MSSTTLPVPPQSDACGAATSSCGCEAVAKSFDGASPAYKRALWVVIGLNGGMFLTEVIAGQLSGSMALQADALDFIGDTLTYGITLAVIGMSLRVRASAALFKGLSLAAMGSYVLIAAIWRTFVAGTPEALTMGVIGFLALMANVASALILLRFRDGDANVQSVWLCSRNDAIGNLAVLAAAGVVAWTGTKWADLGVAAIMAGLFLTSAVRIIRSARAELASVRR